MGIPIKDLTPNFLAAKNRAPALRTPGKPDPLKPLESEKLAKEVMPKPKKKAGGLAKPRGRRQMNKVEASYALILEGELRNGEIERYEWEGMTLRWKDGMTYTPDFVVWGRNSGEVYPVGGPLPIRLIETKGPWIEEDAKVKFRAARAHWPEFSFEMWGQDKKGNWTKLL
jgi:hypothetical protein